MVRAWLGVPVGLLNITLGGSPIESWMDEETLAAWPKALADLEPYRDDEVVRTRSEESIAAMNRWYEDLRTRETEAQSEDLGHGTLTLPAFLKDADPRLTGFRGVIHLRRTVTLPAYAAGQSAALHLGAMVDSDETFVNGVKVGQSEHQYLSRDYMVPEGVLKAGCNEIDVRLVVEHGAGRVTPGKHMHLDMGDDSYNLDGTWTYSIGARTDADCPGEDFVRWKPLGLYNGMTATCAGYAARAALWYQGESNTGDVADDYGRMLAAMIGCWRKAWGQQRLPFLIVQLPVFSIDGVEDGGWALVRKHQWQAAKSIEDVAAVVTLDAGDWNDLHPWNKSVVADRLFAAAQRLVYGKDDAPRSPEPTGVRLADGRLTIAFDDGTGDCGLDTMDGAGPGEFELVWEDGSRHTVPARVEGNTVVIDVSWRRPAAVRYAWRNAPSHGLLCGSNGLPIPPFAESIA
ncbi:sialate O-acetylesterase [Bifidobacterium pseudocatenulatum]|uniref:sialate O-acetylesterase n=1 Tax=Bifidobacterium pseudocatenulatum TaxID=28026 RepID=UPI001CFA1FFB|nr:sialate O-acetylesterase [Bifidobacterium pseudocatenulatum]